MKLRMKHTIENLRNSKWKIHFFCSSIAPVTITLRTMKSVMNDSFSKVMYFENNIEKNKTNTVVMVLILMANIKLGECWTLVTFCDNFLSRSVLIRGSISFGLPKTTFNLWRKPFAMRNATNNSNT